MENTPLVQDIAASTPPTSSQQPATPPTHTRSLRGLFFAGIGMLIGVAALGGVAYAYVEKLGPFSHPPYTQDTLLSGILGSFNKIHSSSFAFSGAVTVGPRDADAVPFDTLIHEDPVFLAQYKNDVQRSTDLENILYELTYRAHTKSQYPASYPTTRTEYIGGKSTLVSAKDPKTGTAYTYHTTDSAKNFELTAVFETQKAVDALQKRVGSKESGTHVVGTTVTFTKDSSPYFYLPSKPERPFLAELADSLKTLPAEFNAMVSVGVTADWTKENSDFQSNISGTGDFGDLSFKVDADILKKDTLYYLRINNIPSVFGAALSSLKGQWIAIDPTQAIKLSHDDPSFLAHKVPEESDSYRKSQERLLAVLKKAIELGDKEHVFMLKNSPQSERVGGKILYRYDLSINKDAFLPFYTKLMNEVNADPQLKELGFSTDQALINYLNGPEFSETFDYYNKNTTLTVWADAQGYIEKVQYTVRVVPPQSAVALKDKQVNLVFTLESDNINKPVVVEKPSNSTSLDEIIKAYGGAAASLWKEGLQRAKR